MAWVAPINIAHNPRTLWFDPNGLEINKDDPVVVHTARGVEFGRAASGLIEVSDEQIAQLKTPLKPVERVATEEDEAKAAELEEKSFEALITFREMVSESELDMHPVSVEFLFDGDKAVFYFESEERVDFRDLVRKLANRFHVRIDMRQIGVRDEARIIGGLGHCGQELCCKRMGGEFCPVSIRMAKEQDLSLNPQKISGLCGRLMCCLRYEYDAYKDFKSRAPKMGAAIKTPAGTGKVVDLDVPREIVSVKVEDEKPVKVPLDAFDEPKEGTRPSVIGEEAWEEVTAEDVTDMLGATANFLTTQFTGSDQLAKAGSISRNPRTKKKEDDNAEGSSKRSRRGSDSSRKDAGKPRNGNQSGKEERRSRRKPTRIAVNETREDGSQESQGGRKSRRRTHTANVSAEGTAANTEKRMPRRTAKAQGSERQGQEGNQQKASVRPGQRSSGLSGSKSSEKAESASNNRQGGTRANGESENASGKNSSRRPRRRSRKKSSSGSESKAGS